MRCRPSLVVIVCLILVCEFLAAHPSAPGASAQQPSDAVDLAAIVLTTPDLENAGFEGYGIVDAGFHTMEDDINAMVAEQQLDSSSVREIFAGAGSAGSYRQTQQIPPSPDEPAGSAGSPRPTVSTRAYLFEDAEGAEAAYRVIINEGELVTTQESDAGIGDQSELSVLQSGPNTTQVELEIRHDRLVLAVSTLSVGEQNTPATVEPGELEQLEALGERLLERAETALNGETANIAPMVLRLESDVTIAPFTAYTMLDRDPIRRIEESDEGYTARIERWREQDFTDHVRSEQPLEEEGSPTGQLRYSAQVFQFGSEQAAIDYMAERVEFFEANPNTEAEVVDAPEIGDQSVMISVTEEANGATQELETVLVVRVGDTVTSSLISMTDPSVIPPEISVETLTKIGEANVECMEAGACDGALPMPEELRALL